MKILSVRDINDLQILGTITIYPPVFELVDSLLIKIYILYMNVIEL